MVFAPQRFSSARRKRNLRRYRAASMAVVLGLSVLAIAGPAAAAAQLTVGPAATYDIVAGSWNEPTSTVPVSGGTAPYTFSVVGGQLPPGISLSADGTFQGTTTATGLFHATVQVTDASASIATSDVAVPVVSVQTVSAQPDGSNSNTPSISDDGNRIAFLTYDPALLGSAPAPQIVVRDGSSPNPLIASSTSTGTPSTGATLGSFVISHNGRYVLIGTDQWAPDGQNPGFWRKDLQTGELRLVANEASNPSLTISPGAISDDGNTAVTQDQTPSGNALLKVVDLTTSPPTPSDLARCPNNGGTESPRMTADGRYVVFEELSACGQAGYHIELLDRTTNVVSEIANRSIGAYSRQADVSADGRSVAFWSDLENGFPPGDFLFDRTTNTPVPVPAPPIDPTGQGSLWLSGDGNRVALGASQSAICTYDRPTQTQSCFDSGGATDPRWEMSGDGQTIAFDGPENNAVYSVRVPPEVVATDRLVNSFSNEPALAVDPHDDRDLLIGYNYGLSPGGCGFARSFDGGNHWKYGVLSQPYGLTEGLGDPAAGFGPDGRAYLACMSGSDAGQDQTNTAIVVATADPGVADFGTPVIAVQATSKIKNGRVRQGKSPDQEHLAVNPVTGQVFVCYTEVSPKHEQINVIDSVNAGITWSASHRVSDVSEDHSRGCDVAVTGSSRVWVAWWDVAQGKARASWSGNGGKRWSLPVELGGKVTSTSVDEDVLGRRISLSADPAPGSPRTVAVWATADTSGVRAETQLSSTEGESWGQTRTVSAADVAMTRQPAVALSADGRIAVGYYAQSTGCLVTYTLGESAWPGDRFVFHAAASAQSNCNITFPSGGLAPRLGDYTSVIETSSLPLAAWTDDRNGGRMDVWLGQ